MLQYQTHEINRKNKTCAVENKEKKSRRGTKIIKMFFFSNEKKKIGRSRWLEVTLYKTIERMIQ